MHVHADSVAARDAAVGRALYRARQFALAGAARAQRERLYLGQGLCAYLALALAGRAVVRAGRPLDIGASVRRPRSGRSAKHGSQGFIVCGAVGLFFPGLGE